MDYIGIRLEEREWKEESDLLYYILFIINRITNNRFSV